MKKPVERALLCLALVLSIGAFARADLLWAAVAKKDAVLFQSARKQYVALAKSKVTAANRSRWESLAERFQKIARDMPRSQYADDALFYAGKLHYELYNFDGLDGNLDAALKNWQGLVVRYPKSPLALQARYALGVGYAEGKRDTAQAKKQYDALLDRAPKSEFATKARERLDGMRRAEAVKKEPARPPDAPPGRAVLTAIRNTSSPSYTRVTIDLSGEVRYESHSLKEDAAKGLPPRIYVDLIGARLATGSTEPLVVQDGLLRQVRVGQFSADVVRVVLDMSSLTGYDTFLLPDPFRLVIDIQGRKQSEVVATVEKKQEGPLPRGDQQPPAGAVRRIVLDPGHGGKDSGAIGVGGVAEKDIVLSVAKRLAQRLKKELGIDVVLTRQDDTFIPLEDRTAIANAKEADLFISLHVNASPNPAARGVETYYLDNTTDEAAIRLAARENGTSRKGITDLQFILSDLTQNSKLEDSITLAHRLQSSLVSMAGQGQRDVKDLGVKKAGFFVLVGAKMPSVLVELFFVTNRVEERALKQPFFQDTVVEALFEGIKKYNESTLVVKNL